MLLFYSSIHVLILSFGKNVPYGYSGWSTQEDPDSQNGSEHMYSFNYVYKLTAVTATIERIDWDVLEVITNRILAEVENVNRVCYDMSPKPPATIEYK